MFSRRQVLILGAAFVSLNLASAGAAENHACVWKVTSPNNHILYLGGSVHALRGIDYPLPAAYNLAFEASDRLVFEVDLAGLKAFAQRVEKEAHYPRGDSLKNHVDPRTYDYLRRLFAVFRVPESKFAVYRPWFIALLLEDPALHGLSSDLGVESYLERRARANHKPMSGLESPREHLEVFSGLSDHQGEVLVLISLVPGAQDPSAPSPLLAAWRRGDVETIARDAHKELSIFPAFEDRVLDARTRNWIPRIERDLQSGHTCFVVVGAGHMGGPNGVLALLRARGYAITQL
ncbi:MAG: TraB/GumN family protein [Chthoniobacterales bacterium]|nr:TraB/GumN family protein [Chthoniobacterales bacterium]